MSINIKFESQFKLIKNESSNNLLQTEFMGVPINKNSIPIGKHINCPNKCFKLEGLLEIHDKYSSEYDSSSSEALTCKYINNISEDYSIIECALEKI